MTIKKLNQKWHTCPASQRAYSLKLNMQTLHRIGNRGSVVNSTLPSRGEVTGLIQPQVLQSPVVKVGTLFLLVNYLGKIIIHTFRTHPWVL